MIIKPCPRCGRKPKIREGCRRKNGNRFFMIGCPNYCPVLKNENRNSLHYPFKRSWLEFEGTYDNNYMYRKWNEELINE